MWACNVVSMGNLIKSSSQCFGLEGNLKILSFQLPAMGRDLCRHLLADVGAEQGHIYMTRRVTKFYGVYLVFSHLGELG